MDLYAKNKNNNNKKKYFFFGLIMSVKVLYRIQEFLDLNYVLILILILKVFEKSKSNLLSTKILWSSSKIFADNIRVMIIYVCWKRERNSKLILYFYRSTDDCVFLHYFLCITNVLYFLITAKKKMSKAIEDLESNFLLNVLQYMLEDW